MAKGVRLLIAVVAGFVVWRVGVEVLPVLVALLLALAAGAAGWMLTGRRG